MAKCYMRLTPNGADGGPCRRPHCQVCYPPTAIRSPEEINEENKERQRMRELETRLRTEQNEREAIFSAGCSLIGSRIWDGGRTALPTSDIDVFFAVDPCRLATHRPNGKAFVEAVRPLHLGLIRVGVVDLRPVDLVGGQWHWALTGREERQCVVLSGQRPEFRPAPANATSAMIRRAALRLMGVKLCLPSKDVDDTHLLCQEDAVTNALRWVQARAVHWEDAALGELAGRIDEAVRAGLDVRAVLV